VRTAWLADGFECVMDFPVDRIVAFAPTEFAAHAT